jgi:hypothetical protein
MLIMHDRSHEVEIELQVRALAPGARPAFKVVNCLEFDIYLCITDEFPQFINL